MIGATCIKLDAIRPSLGCGHGCLNWEQKRVEATVCPRPHSPCPLNGFPRWLLWVPRDHRHTGPGAAGWTEILLFSLSWSSCQTKILKSVREKEVLELGKNLYPPFSAFCSSSGQTGKSEGVRRPSLEHARPKCSPSAAQRRKRVDRTALNHTGSVCLAGLSHLHSPWPLEPLS